MRATRGRCSPSAAEQPAAGPARGGHSRDRTRQLGAMAEATAAPVRAAMRGRLRRPGLGGGEEAGAGSGPGRPRVSAAAARPGGPRRTAAPGDAGGRGSDVSSPPAPRGFVSARRTGRWARGGFEILHPVQPGELSLLGAAGQPPARRPSCALRGLRDGERRRARGQAEALRGPWKPGGA